MRSFVLAASLALATACVPTDGNQVTKGLAPEPAGTATTHPALAFTANPAFASAPAGSSRGNAVIARDFIDLSFNMESGRALPTFSRFEGTVTIALAGDVPASASSEMARLIKRFRNEAGIDVRSAAPGEKASITVTFGPKSELRRLAPTAACFVVPNVSSVADYKAKRGTAAVDWTNVVQRQHVGIFVPSDASPQEIRDCLNEETAQAMGPLNDLYRLPDSVFNDDNFHSVLTSFDMLILRAYYSPEIRSGMSREQVTAKIPGIINRLNPGGVGRGSAGKVSMSTKAWKSAIETALGSNSGQTTRRAAAERSLMIARAQGWSDGRLAFSHFAIARLYVGSDRALAVQEFTRAAEIYRRQPGASLQVAHIEMQLAAIAVANGQPQQAIAFADRAIPVVRGGENYALLATTQLIKAEALDMLGRGIEAQALRVDSQQSARYGFGSDAQVRARTREIAALGARGSRG